MNEPPLVTLLIVKDRREDLAALAELLSPLGQHIVTAETAGSALELARRDDVALAIVDVHLPDVDGLALVARLRADESTRALPVIFVSADEPTPELRRRMFALRAVDFIALPAAPLEIEAKAEVFIALHRQKQQLVNAASETRRLADTALRAQFDRFRLFMDSASEYGLLFLDRAGMITEWTAGAEKLFGYTAEEAVGRDFSLIFTAADRARGSPAREMKAATDQGESSDCRYHQRKDGSTFYVSGRLVALRRPGGLLEGFAKVLRDATEQLKLQESEAKFREIFETANEGAWILDADGRVELVNQRMAEMLGYAIEEIVGRFKREFTFPEDQAYIQGLFEERKRGLYAAIEVRFRHRDGREVWTLLSARPRYSDGRFSGALDMFTDVTERRRAIEALRASEADLRDSQAQLQLAIEAAELGTFYFDAQDNDHQWSPRMKAMLGLPDDTVPSPEVFFSVVEPDDRARVEQEWHRISNTWAAGDFQVGFRVRWPDGTLRYMDANSRTIAGAPGGHRGLRIVGTLRDVTATRNAEAELQRKVAERTAALQEKTAQLETFCYTVAHDLRSPLRAISGYADILREDFTREITPEGAEYFNKIRASAERLDLLIKDLLTYSRITQVDLAGSDVPLLSAVEWALKQLAPEIQAKDASVVVPAGMPTVRGDRSLLDQVALNLLSNAIKFVPPDRKPKVDIETQRRDGMVRLLVRDNGVGIAPQYHERIFRVFERLNDAREVPGTGVGLAIVARAAQRLGGSAGVESVPGLGSTFWIEVPGATP